MTLEYAYDERYYLIESGRVMEAIQEMDRREGAFHDHWEGLRDKYECIACSLSGGRITGLEFITGPPEGWVEIEESGYFRPSQRTKDGKAEYLEIRGDVGFPDFPDFARIADLRRAPIGVNRRGFTVNVFPSYELIGAKYVLALPVDESGASQTAPEGCTPLKKSEYWAMVEAEEAKKGTNP